MYTVKYNALYHSDSKIEIGCIMSDEQTVNDLSAWFPTYGIITAQRLLERYRINLSDTDLLNALKTPNSFYHRILNIPMKNVFNGIILQQARDYQIYAQKIFVDYLMSGENSKTPETPGGEIRERVEEQRVALNVLGDGFDNSESEHNKLITDTQVALMQQANNWQKAIHTTAQELPKVIKLSNSSEAAIKQALSTLLVEYDLSEQSFTISAACWERAEKLLDTPLTTDMRETIQKAMLELANQTLKESDSLNDYKQQVSEINDRMRDYRKQFANLIIKTNELIQLLPDYKADKTQIHENQEQLYFDAHLGDSE